MDAEMKEKMNRLKDIIAKDKEYRQMLEQFKVLERQFDAIVGRMPLGQQDLIWDYVSASNAVDALALKIACREMEFLG